jgi:hypothetical protein
MKRVALLLGVLFVLSMVLAVPALAGKKGIGVSCKSNSECATGYCKPNKAHLPGYIGTCQRK